MPHGALRVFFGHQSVGANVLDGVEEVGPGRVHFEHRLLGTNGDPLSKLAAFELAVAEVAGRVHLAFFKFCYADFTALTDVDALFAAYQHTLSRLQSAYPRVAFAHVTVPLTVVQGGVTGWVKRHLGLGAWGELENVKRHAFNQRLRDAYRGAPLFDLALVESTRADGTQETWRFAGLAAPKLRADFTDDGGHLNQQGRLVVARALLSFLGTIEPPSSEAPD